MKIPFSVVAIVCSFCFLAGGHLWVPAAAGTTSTMVLSGDMPLVCYNISASPIGSGNATIRWATNGYTNGTVDYGTTSEYGLVFANDSMVINHTVLLPALLPATRYHYRILSKTGYGMSCAGPGGSFKTLFPAGTVVVTKNATTEFTGVGVKTVDGSQQVVLNISEGSGTPEVSGNTVTINNPGNGWSSVQFTGTDVTDIGGEISIDGIREVTLKGEPVNADLGGEIGTISTQMDIAMNSFVSGVTIQQSVVEGASASAAGAFQLAATGSNLDLMSVAYTVVFQDTGPLNANLGDAGATLTLSIDHAWVVANAPGGDTNNIRILRSGEDGRQEVLETRYTGSQGTTDFFSARSPRGLSVFGIAAVSAKPPVTVPTAGPVYPSPATIRMDSDSGMPASAGTLKKTTAPAVKKTVVPLTSPSSVPVLSDGMTPQNPVQAPSGQIPEPWQEPAGFPRFFEDNILMLCMFAGTAGIGIVLAIWYRWRDRQG